MKLKCSFDKIEIEVEPITDSNHQIEKVYLKNICDEPEINVLKDTDGKPY
jgi:hypothetical protein